MRAPKKWLSEEELRQLRRLATDNPLLRALAKRKKRQAG